MHCIVVRAAILSNSCGGGAKMAMIESFGCYGNDPFNAWLLLLLLLLLCWRLSRVLNVVVPDNGRLHTPWGRSTMMAMLRVRSGLPGRMRQTLAERWALRLVEKC